MDDNLKNNATKKLGSGLSVLIGERNKSNATYGSKNNERIEDIALNNIIPGIYQPRKSFNQEELQDLANSIKENGLMQPIILRKAENDQMFEIIAGERRFRACKMLGLNSIAAIVKKINNHQALELAIIENVQRSDLSLIEEAAGYRQLIDEFSYTQEELSKKIGKSRSHITNILRLLSLPEIAKELLNKKAISMGHARAILTSKNQEELVKKIIDNSMTVREVENEVRNEKIITQHKKLSTQSDNENSYNLALLQTEKQIKFISNQYLSELSQQLSILTDCNIKINYNNSSHKGKIELLFEDISQIQNLIYKLRNHS